MIRLAVALAALAELALVRLLPETGGGLYLRLAAATIVVLLPGGLVAEALGRRSTSATIVWMLAALAGALAVTFAARSSLSLTLLLLAVVSIAAAPLALLRKRPRRLRGSGLFLVAGAALGVALWHVAGHVDGDALFHLARVRKLEALSELSLRGVDEFRDGGLHPGYAFPLWHGLLAVVARLAGVDPADVVLHEPSLLAPLALVVAYEAGTRLFASRLAGASVALAQVALSALAAGHGGGYRVLSLPGTAARQLLALAALALVFEALDDRSWRSLASVAAAGLVLTLVHPTYALFLLVPLGGSLVARALLERRDLGALAAAVAAFALPTGAVVAWLLPLVREAASYRPSATVRCGAEHGVARYANQLDVFSCHSYRLAPEVLGRGGAIAVAALCLVPLAALAARRRWAAYVLGGSLAVLGLMLVPFLFTALADTVSLSQARRAAGFFPFSFALAGGIVVLTRALGPLVLPAALAAGIALQALYPGDFSYRFEHGGPALATWLAALGGGGALVAAAVHRRPVALERPDVLSLLAAVLFVAPVAVHGLGEWTPPSRPSATALPTGLVAALRREVPERGVVLSDVETSYLIAAAAPVYVASAPPAHVADTGQNRPYERAEDTERFLRTGDLELARRYGAGWIVLDGKRTRLRLPLPLFYGDERYALYRLGQG